ncbi:MAG: TolC family protein [Muribaculaceae bacterium]
MNSKSMKKAIIFAVAAFAAATAGARTLSQAEAIDTIISNNSRLKALRANAEADYQSDLYEAKRLNDPEVEFEHLWGPDDNKKWNIGVSQSFDWPGAYGKRIRTAESRRQAWTYRYAAEELSLRTSAKEAFAMGVYARRRLDLLQRVYENMDSLRNYITTGYRDGQLTILDVKKIQLELYGLRARIADVSQESMQAGAELAALNDGNAIDADFGAYPAEPMYDLSRYLEYASSANPDVTAAEATAKSARLEADAVAASRMPGFTVGYRHAFEEEQHFNGFAIGVSLPVYSRSRAVKAAKLRATASGFDAAEASASARSAVTAAYSVAEKRRNALSELNDVTLDESYPRLLLMAYKGGQINVITYIQELNYYLSARETRLDAEYQLRLALITLNKYNPAE